jgi:hypothetical protein
MFWFLTPVKEFDETICPKNCRFSTKTFDLKQIDLQNHSSQPSSKNKELHFHTKPYHIKS